MPLKPIALRPGDRIGLIAPSSPPADPAVIDRAVKGLEHVGFEVVLGAAVRKRLGFLAGDDKARAADFNRFARDRSVRAIMCLRGGHGCTRILPLLDKAALKRDPKVLCGYSDVTALHLFLLTQIRCVAFHGPMGGADFSRDKLDHYTMAHFVRSVAEAQAAGSVFDGSKRRGVVLRRGNASGILVGGNLSVLCALLGTPYFPKLKGSILMLEDVNEPPYRIDRMLTQLRLSGELAGVKAIGLGAFTACADRIKARGRQSTENVLEERLATLGIPVVAGLPFGHIDSHATFPLGVRATLDGRRGDLIIEEAAVRAAARTPKR